MAKLRLTITMSLDGYVAGPRQSLETPLGEGGEALHTWALATRSWRAQHGREGGEGGVDDEQIQRSTAGIGAVVMGRNMFGPVRGPWGDESWRGWWGEDPPFNAPVFVLTHHARDALQMQGGTTFHFVTEGIGAALERAAGAAAGEDVLLAGGAAAAQQYLRAGLVDEMMIHVVPVLLGGGERLFERLEGGPRGLECVELVSSPAAAHYTYRRRNGG